MNTHQQWYIYETKLNYYFSKKIDPSPQIQTRNLKFKISFISENSWNVWKIGSPPVAAITRYTPTLHFSRNAIMGPAMTYPNRAESSRRVDTKGRSVDSCGPGDEEGRPHPRADESRVVKPPTHRPTRPTALPDDPNLPHVWLAWGGLRAGTTWRARLRIEGARQQQNVIPSCHRDTLLPRPGPSDSVTLLPLGNPRHREPRAVRAREQGSRVRNTPRLFSTLRLLCLYGVESGNWDMADDNSRKIFSYLYIFQLYRAFAFFKIRCCIFSVVDEIFRNFPTRRTILSKRNFLPISKRALISEATVSNRLSKIFEISMKLSREKSLKETLPRTRL